MVCPPSPAGQGPTHGRRRRGTIVGATGPTIRRRCGDPMPERFLVTGALGCIGAWVVRGLLEEGVDVVALDRGGSDHRVRQIVDAGSLERLERVDCDIADLPALAAVVADRAITHV